MYSVALAGVNDDGNIVKSRLFFDCSNSDEALLRNGTTARLDIDVDTNWDDFRQETTEGFRANVEIAYKTSKAEMVPTENEDDFNWAWEQIEDEWSKGGASTISCTKYPPAATAQFHLPCMLLLCLGVQQR